MKTIASIYVLAMVTANLLVWWLGPWFSPINSFILIGLDLTLRDVMHDRMTRWQMLSIVLVGGLITWGLNPSAANIAIASAVAFTISACADWLAYTMLRSKPWLVRSNGSNVVGAAVDSIIFPTLAFGSFLPHIVAMQFAAKVSGGAVWSYLLRKPVSSQITAKAPVESGGERVALFNRLGNMPIDAWRFNGLEASLVLSALAARPTESVAPYGGQPALKTDSQESPTVEHREATDTHAELVERLREGVTVLDEPFHRQAIADTMNEAAAAITGLSAKLTEVQIREIAEQAVAKHGLSLIHALERDGDFDGMNLSALCELAIRAALAAHGKG